MKTITGGAFQDSKGNAANGATITFVLLTPEVATNTGQVYPNTVSFVLDTNGNLPANSQIWANDELTPTGSVYRVTVVTSGGVVLYGPQSWSIVGTSPISITNMTPVSTPAGLVVSNVAIEPGPTDSVLYVSHTGNDSNDGLSWGTSLATYTAALNKLAGLTPVGGTIHIGAGTFTGAPYSLNTAFGAVNGAVIQIRIVGQGVNKTTLQLSSAGSIFSYAGAVNISYGLELENLTLDGNNLTGSSGLTLIAMNQMYIHNVRVIHCDTNFISLSAINLGILDNVLLQSPQGTNATGLLFAGTGGSNSAHIIANFLRVDSGTFKYAIATEPISTSTGVSFLECNNCLLFNKVALTNVGDVLLNQCDFETVPGLALDVGDISLNATAAAHSITIINGFYDTSSGASSNSANFDNVQQVEFVGHPSFNQHINFTNNVRLVSGTLSLANAPTIANSTAFAPDFRYTLNGTSWVYPSTLRPVLSGNEVMTETGTGFGNGAAGTAVTTTLKGTGTGPTTPQTVVKYVSIDVAGVTYWVPLVQ